MNKLKKALLRAEEEARGAEPRGEPRPEPRIEPRPAETHPLPDPPPPPSPPLPQGEGRGEGGAWEHPAAAPVAERIRDLCWDERVFDELRGLRAQVLARLDRAGGRCILVTSPDAREGKSFTALHLAVSLSAELGRPTLLVDAAPGPSSLARSLGLDGPAGLSGGSPGGAANRLVTTSGLPHLRFLPSGGGGGFFGNDWVKGILDEFHARHPETVVILDGSALSEGPGAGLLAELADGVLLVVEAERTAKRTVRSALNQLGGLPLLGLVLNKWRGPLG